MRPYTGVCAKVRCVRKGYLSLVISILRINLPLSSVIWTWGGSLMLTMHRPLTGQVHLHDVALHELPLAVRA